jgi:feruloyl esterase
LIIMTGLRRYAFSERIADILGVSRRDLRFRVTLMITEGLAAPGPRGPGSPPATPQYAADLLIGIMAAPQQVHTVEAIRCYRELQPTVMVADTAGPGVSLGGRGVLPGTSEAPSLPLLPDRLRFGEAVARLLDQARDSQTCAMLARELFGIWVSRSFPVAAVQFAAWSEGRRAVITQRYELPEGGHPPAWLDPNRGGVAGPGLFHSVFLPVGKLIEIGRLTTSQRKPPMLNLDQTISKLADLANLVRDRRHRRPWEKFLTVAEKARAVAEKIDARGGSHLTEVSGFGSNPGNLRMLTYVPNDLPEAAALVVVLHGCTQTARSYDIGTGWSTLADRHGFALLLPEQRGRNNPLRCFNWFRSEDFTRESGEPLSIRQMVDWMIANHGIDRRRVYVTGVSSGAAMTSVMLATYPEVFASGAIIAGVPYRCADGLQEGFEVLFEGKSQSAREWGDVVRAASPHQGPWPKVSVWHGAADSTVNPTNAEEILKQWTDVHGLTPAPTMETTVDGHPYRVWQGPDGEDLIEAYTINGMAHGQPIDPRREGGCGAAAPFILDIGISSTHHIARFWGLTELRPQASATPHRPVHVIDSGAGARARATDESPSGHTTPEADVKPAGEGASPGVDLQQVFAKALDAAGLSKGRRDVPPGSSGMSGMIPIVDLQKILSTSFEAAGLLKGQGGASSGSGGGAGGGTEGGTARGIDIASILAKSFEAAGLLKGRGGVPPAPREEAGREEAGGLAGSGWEGDGWQFTTDARADNRTVLFGYAASGKGGTVGNTVRSVSRQFVLAQRPKLSYVRKLNLGAAVNILTTASFRVLVDGVPVDEVSAVGMDYDEAEWTQRGDIDLARFAGRTVTLMFEVAANSNVFIEVFAKAWVSGITIGDAPAG